MTVLGGPDELTTAFVAAAVTRATGRPIEVRGLSTTALGTGQMGDTYRIGLDVAPGAAVDSVVAKFASRDERSRQIGLALRAYEVEVRFYQELAPRVAARTPRCYHAAVDTTSGAFTLLLEDCRDAAPGDQLTGISESQARDALDELAALHAPTLDQPWAAGATWLNRSTPEGEAAMRAMLAALVPDFLERYGDQLADVEVDVVTAVAGAPPRHPEGPSPRVAAHGDFRADNLLFPAGGGRPVVVDFQTVTWGHPALDVAYLLSTSLTIEDRRAGERDLIDHYLDTLDRSGAPIDRQAFCASYSHEARYGVNMAVGASMLVERTDRGDEMFLTHTRRHVAQLLDWGLADQGARDG